MLNKRTQLLDARSITLEQLRVLVSIVEVGGFQGASRQIASNAISSHPKPQETRGDIGVPFVATKARTCSRADYGGRAFFLSGAQNPRQVSDALATVQKPELSGRIALGVPDDFGIVDLHEAISRCVDLNRKLRIQVTSALSAELFSLIRRGDLDMAIIKQTASDKRGGSEHHGRLLVSRMLRAEPLHWVSSRRVAFGDLNEMPLVAFPDGCAYRRVALAALD